MRVVNVRDYGGRGGAERAGVTYIGRGSVLGNPFVMGRDGSREQVIEAYRQWLWKRIREGNAAVLNALRAIEEGESLGCWCKPLGCHGDVVVRAARWLKTQEAA